MSADLDLYVAERLLEQKAAAATEFAKAVNAVLGARGQDDPGRYYRRQLHRREAERIVQQWRAQTGGQSRYGELMDMIADALEGRA